MGLDLYPRRETNLNAKNAFPSGKTHRTNAACPFAPDDFPIGLFGTCCSLRGKEAAEHLRALGERNACEHMYDDMGAGEALAFATVLRATAKCLEHSDDSREDEPCGGSEDDTMELATGTFTPRLAPSFEEALASIRQAADWYEKVARLGFGVHAWY